MWCDGRGKIFDGSANKARGVQPLAIWRMPALYRAGATMMSVLAAMTVADCSALTGNANTKAAPDPNAFPAQYQLNIAKYLRTELQDRSDFHGAMISQPAIKPVETSQRYVVCVRFNPRSKIKDKAAVFLSGSITQFVDATPAQCGDAQYQPFRELDAVGPG
jgi:hypothetical protein